MSEKKNLTDEQLEKASGGFNNIRRPKGYWYRVSGDGNPYRYLDDKYGIETAVERDSQLENSIRYAETHGVVNITSDKGYID